jgi:hypothetical protein
MDKTTMPPRPGLCTTALALAMLCGALAPAAAQAQNVYLCIDSAGRKELTDTYKAGCKALDIPGAIPAPRSRGSAAKAAAPVTTPADFPRVDNAQQKARDSDRRAILLDELKSDEARLAQLRIEYKAGQPERQGDERNIAKYQERVKLMGDNIARAEKNVEALRREIANIK